MDLNNFSKEERQALLDLFVLGMYADGHLASAEDAQARRLLAEMGFEALFERNRELDAAITRVRKHTSKVQDTRLHVITLAQSFSSPEQRRRVYGLLADLMVSDSEVAPAENRFLTMVKDVFAA